MSKYVDICKKIIIFLAPEFARVSGGYTLYNVVGFLPLKLFLELDLILYRFAFIIQAIFGIARLQYLFIQTTTSSEIETL